MTASTGHGHLQRSSMTASCDTLLNDTSARVDNLDQLRSVGWILAGAGAATLVTGAVLVLTAPDPHKFDEKPVDRLLVGWRLSPQVGIGRASVTVTRVF
jgi:hypothetical protein